MPASALLVAVGLMMVFASWHAYVSPSLPQAIRPVLRRQALRGRRQRCRSIRRFAADLVGCVVAVAAATWNVLGYVN